MNWELSHTVTVLEALWTLCGAVGVGFAVHNLLEALRELRTLRRAGVASKRRRVLTIVARGGVRTAVLRLVKLATVITIGVLAMLTDNPPDTVPWTPLRYAVVIGLLLIPILLTVVSIGDTLELRALQRELAELDKPTT